MINLESDEDPIPDLRVAQLESDKCGPVSHDEASEIVQQFIDHFFKNFGKPKPNIEIPANPKRDADLRLHAYVMQQRAAGVESGRRIASLEAELADMTRLKLSFEKLYLDATHVAESTAAERDELQRHYRLRTETLGLVTAERDTLLARVGELEALATRIVQACNEALTCPICKATDERHDSDAWCAQLDALLNSKADSAPALEPEPPQQEILRIGDAMTEANDPETVWVAITEGGTPIAAASDLGIAEMRARSWRERCISVGPTPLPHVAVYEKRNPEERAHLLKAAEILRMPRMSFDEVEARRRAIDEWESADEKRRGEP